MAAVRTAFAVALCVGVSAVLSVGSAVASGESGGPATGAPLGPGLVQITDDGAWCWFGDPRAVAHAGAHRRTYVGWVTSRGGIRVASYDHDTEVVETATLREKLQQNDHASPAIYVRPDGRVAVFYSTHRGSRIYYRVSEEPEDVSSWGVERMTGAVLGGNGGYTYPSPLPGPGGDALLFFRGPGYQPSLLSWGEGDAWDAGRELLGGAGERPYAKYAVRDGAVHMAFTDGHPRDEPQNSIHYARLEGGVFRRADGTTIAAGGELPFDAGASDTVYDGAAAGAPAWIWDVAVDGEGRPVIVYAVFPAVDDHRYRYARWNGGAWEDHEIVAAGSRFPTVSEGEKRFEPHYSGGLTLDGNDPSVVYLSRPVRGVFEIERWVTADGGASWTSEAVTKGSDASNVRPVVPRNRLDDGPGVLWMRGGYTDYSYFDTAIVGLVPQRGGGVVPRGGEGPGTAGSQ